MANLTQSIGTLLKASIFIQLISFGFYPIFTRLYEPSEFGTYGVVFAAVNLFMPLLSLKLDIAIIQENDIKKREDLFHVILTVNLIISFLASIINVIYLNDAVYFSSIYLFLLSFLFLYIFGFFQANNQLFVSEEKFTLFSRALLLEKISMICLKTLGGLFFGNWLSLYLSEIGAKLSALIYQRKVVGYDVKFLRFSSLKVFSWSSYKKYYTYDLASDFLDSASNSVPILIFGIYYTKESLGVFLFVYTLYKVGLKLWGKSTSPVFFKSLVSTKPEDRAKTAEILIRVTISIVVILQTILLLFERSTYRVVFGNEWGEIYDVAFILCLGLSPILLVKNIGNIFRVYGKQNLLAGLGVLNSASFILSAYISSIWLDFKYTIVVFSIVSYLVYNLYVIIGLGVMGIRKIKALKLILPLDLILVLIFYLSFSETSLSQWYMKLVLGGFMFYKLLYLKREWNILGKV